MNQHRKLTKEFAVEAVALLRSSGCIRHQVAAHLGIELSTLAPCRDRNDGKPDASDEEVLFLRGAGDYPFRRCWRF